MTRAQDGWAQHIEYHRHQHRVQRAHHLVTMMHLRFPVRDTLLIRSLHVIRTRFRNRSAVEDPNEWLLCSARVAVVRSHVGRRENRFLRLQEASQQGARIEEALLALFPTEPPVPPPRPAGVRRTVDDDVRLAGLERLEQSCQLLRVVGDAIGDGERLKLWDKLLVMRTLQRVAVPVKRGGVTREM
jgi:hypothetical protein